MKSCGRLFGVISVLQRQREDNTSTPAEQMDAFTYVLIYIRMSYKLTILLRYGRSTAVWYRSWIGLEHCPCPMTLQVPNPHKSSSHIGKCVYEMLAGIHK